jgi:methylated-DNA-[protein]-cysteine S-methyltransferase
MATWYYTRMESPLGGILLVGEPAGLRRIAFLAGNRPLAPDPAWEPGEAPFREAVRQLEAYFAGTLTGFDLPLLPQGTPFQRTVWQALCEIPYGETISYGSLARRIGRPTASRAVGAANGRNPLPIVVPCHRVIGENGKLTGYYGGVHLKAGLLALEQRHRPAASHGAALQTALF